MESKEKRKMQNGFILVLNRIKPGTNPNQSVVIFWL